jgi:hypothetical protein
MKDFHKVMRVRSGSFLLPGIAAAVLSALQGASAKDLKRWKLPKWLDTPSFITGSNFLLAPVSIQTLNQITTILEDTNNQKVRIRDRVHNFAYLLPTTLTVACLVFARISPLPFLYLSLGRCLMRAVVFRYMFAILNAHRFDTFLTLL